MEAAGGMARVEGRLNFERKNFQYMIFQFCRGERMEEVEEQQEESEGLICTPKI